MTSGDALLRTILLFRVTGELFGVDKQHLVGIADKDSAKLQVKERDGTSYLQLAKGKEAKIYDLEKLFGKVSTGNTGTMYFILDIDGELLSLHVSARGGLISVQQQDIRPLPPLFRKEVQALFPETVLNGADSILLLAPKALMDLV